MLLTYGVAFPAKILDVGCGRGNFLKASKQLGFECCGIEIDEFGSLDLGKDIIFLRGHLEDLPIQEGTFDAVSIWHVLEHTLNPAAAIKKAAQVLRPGGIIAIAVPNFGSFQSYVFGGYWFHLDLPRHVYHFSKDALVSKLREHNLEPIKISTASIGQNCFGFIQSSLNLLFPAGMANLLFKRLKNRGAISTGSACICKLALLGNMIAVALLLPLALLENLFSVLLGKGATLVIYARKKA